ncbi:MULTISPECIES: adenine methyltransferase [Lactococcus]|nr:MULTISPECIES: adenine methyltransferase [Lactococcus]WKY23512.1 adenine methyltransferase [Lactococcus sp. bn62]
MDYNLSAQHSTAQHSTAQHSTAQHSTAQHSTAQHSTAQHSTGGNFLFFFAYIKTSCKNRRFFRIRSFFNKKQVKRGEEK